MMNKFFGLPHLHSPFIYWPNFLLLWRINYTWGGRIKKKKKQLINFLVHPILCVWSFCAAAGSRKSFSFSSFYRFINEAQRLERAPFVIKTVFGTVSYLQTPPPLKNGAWNGRHIKWRGQGLLGQFIRRDYNTPTSFPLPSSSSSLLLSLNLSTFLYGYDYCSSSSTDRRAFPLSLDGRRVFWQLIFYCAHDDTFSAASRLLSGRRPAAAATE